MNRLRGLDVSSYQSTIDWAKVKAAGYGFAYAKATEGTSYVDPCFADNHDGAKKAGIPFGAYHFFHFGADPLVQAKHFLATINGCEGTLLPMVDVEGGGQDGVTDLPTLIARLSTFTSAIEETLRGRKMLVYADYGDWNGFMQGTDAFSGHPFFVAEYNSDPAPTLPNGWKTWAVWQHSSGGTVDGISGFVDLDVLNGTDLSIITREAA